MLSIESKEHISSTLPEVSVLVGDINITSDTDVSKENIKKPFSLTKSNAAKNGYAEEDLVCLDFNTNLKLRAFFETLIPNTYDTCSRFKGNSKIDISSENGELTAQVKKYKHAQFQQLDRHWVEDLINHVPELKKIQFMLKGLCEYKLLENGTHVDKTVPIIKLCQSNYCIITLNELVAIFNVNRRKILEYAFYGTNETTRPKYLIGVEYANKIRSKIVIFKISDIISYLDTLKFRIKQSKSVIALGEHDAITLQRKGGDNGLKSANQLQFKIIISSLLNVEHIAFTL